MGSASSIPADKHIVIVGAGYAGIELGLALLKSGANFSIINPGDCFHHNIASPRAIVVPGFANKVCIPLGETFGSHFVKAKVVAVKPGDKKVTLESGEDMGYDYLVIATGTTYKAPLKLGGVDREASLSLYSREVEKIKAAQKVVIVGGGATGIETAGEVAAEYPDKEVTIVHSSQALLVKALSDSSQNKLRSMLEKEMKIKLILGEKVTNLSEAPEEGSFTLITDKGTNIEADYVFNAIGLKVDTAAYENGLNAATEENGALKVNQYLQVEGHEDSIFAIGDCNNAKEPKMAFLAQEQAKVLAKTIKSLLRGGKPTVYKEDGIPVLAGASIGPAKGFVQTKIGITMPNFMVVSLKCKDLLTGKTWKQFNQKMPSIE